MAGHSEKTFNNVYNENTKYSAQKLIQAIESKLGGTLSIMEKDGNVDVQLEKDIQEKREALQQHMKRERLNRIYSSDGDDENLSMKHPVSNSHKIRFWLAALGEFTRM